MQVVDSRDVPQLVVALVTDDRRGTDDAVGPAEPVTLTGQVQTCAAAAGSTVELVPVEPGFPLMLPDESWDALFRRGAAWA